jgi:uncharacterized protein
MNSGMQCWVISDGAAGNARQALALAERLDCTVRDMVLQPRPPWSWLAPHLTIGGRLALTEAERVHFAPPWPAIAIGCGRAAALFTRQLRELSGGHCLTVQILDPRASARHWDVVIAPRHDGLAGDNVLTPLGSLNPVDANWLRDGRDADPGLGELAQPRVGVLLGGPRRGVVMDGAYIERLAASLRARQHKDGGSLMVVASRRTPDTAVQTMRKALLGIPGLVWSGDNDGANPYPGVLGWADRLVVTPDSVNMLSEACATGCPVHTLVVGSLPEKLAQFHAALRDAGLLHDVDATTVLRQKPLRETVAIAAQLRALLLERRG